MSIELAPIWASVTDSAFRLELLQTYRIQSEEARIRAWQAGEPWPTARTAWQDRLVDLAERGVAVRRVHVVDQPLSDYLRWQIAGYTRNLAFGEDIRLLTRTNAPPLPPHDFWLFDDQTVVLMHYDSEGRLTSRDLFAGDPAPYCAARDTAWAYAEPIQAWCRHWDCG